MFMFISMFISMTMLNCTNGVMWGSCDDWFDSSLHHSWWMLYILHAKACEPEVIELIKVLVMNCDLGLYLGYICGLSS